MFKNTQNRYGSIAKLFHWVIFILVFCLILVGYFMHDISDKVTRSDVVNAHKITGITVFILMLLRAAWAIANPKPVLLEGTSIMQRYLERIMHLVLYALLIAMPLCGWVGATAAGRAPHLFGWYLALPISQDKSLSHYSFSLHSTLAIIIIIAVSLHIVAALYHHFVYRDDVLRRMMPSHHRKAY